MDKQKETGCPAIKKSDKGLCGNPIKEHGYCGIHKHLGVQSEPALPSKRDSPKKEKESKKKEKDSSSETSSNKKGNSLEKKDDSSSDEIDSASDKKEIFVWENKEKVVSMEKMMKKVEYLRPITDLIKKKIHLVPTNDDENRYSQIVKDLMKIPQPEQRSENWYKMRNERITASDAASCLIVTEEDVKREKKGYLILKSKVGKCANPYKSRSEFILNKCVETAFKGNNATKWGQKYENVACQIYEKRHGVNVLEFGLLPHPSISWLGASPDGITTNGIMLEIKCPYSDRDLGPPFHYYWVQIQLQLETCNLDYCDFQECKITEYKSEKAYYNDGGETGLTKDRLEKGILLKVSQDIEGETESKSFYVYPILGTDNEVKKWINNWIIEDMKQHTMEYFTGTRYGEFQYWRLQRASCIRIKKEPEWFEENIPNFKAAWDDVLKCRENKEELDKLIKKRKPKKVFDIGGGNDYSTQTASTSLFKGCMIDLDN